MTLPPARDGTLPGAPPPPRGGAIPGAVGRMALLALGLGVAGWLLRALADAPGPELVDRFVRDQGLTGEAIFVLAGAAVTAAGVPRQALAFLGGYAFGALGGGALALLAQALGCVLCFGWARLVGRGWAARLMRGRFGRRVEPLHDALTESPFGATLALRLLPIGNNLALNLLGGLSGVAAAPFLAASVIGYVPQTAVFALLGGGVSVERSWQVALGAVLFAVSAGIGVAMLRRHRAGRAMQSGE